MYGPDWDEGCPSCSSVADGFDETEVHLPFEGPGMSAFAMQDGAVFHTYSAYARGLDACWNMWQRLDRAPLGRNEGDFSWFGRRDTYAPERAPDA